jgi:hypothetical protein
MIDHDIEIGMILGAFLGIIITALICIDSYKSNKDIIKHECGQYNQITGDFEWKHELKG